MPTIRFSREHEYIRVEGDVGAIGITAFAQSHLGDIIFVELPDIGKMLAPGDAAAVVESVKAASDIFSPVSGEVTETNSALAHAPSLVNEDPLGKGWFFKIRFSNLAELEGLMDEAAYETYIKPLT
jgi:glycine cleavage system H protein